MFEVAEELLPFQLGRDPVLGAGAQRSAAGDERPVPVDHLVGVDGLVTHGGVDVAVSGDELGDVRWHAVQDGVGDEQPEVVRGEPQRLTSGVGNPSAGGKGDPLADGVGGDGAVLDPEPALEQQRHRRFQTRSWES